MEILEECLNKADIEKVSEKFWAMYQCIFNVPLGNDWSKVHGYPVLKALSFKRLSWISATKFIELIRNYFALSTYVYGSWALFDEL